MFAIYFKDRTAKEFHQIMFGETYTGSLNKTYYKRYKNKDVVRYK